MVPFTQSTLVHSQDLAIGSHAGPSGDLRDSARRLGELERVRMQLVGTLLAVQQACSLNKDQDHAQRLISAAVRDLEDHDAVLFEARTNHSMMETAGDRLVR